MGDSDDFLQSIYRKMFYDTEDTIVMFWIRKNVMTGEWLKRFKLGIM
jgi:hypothetical protein